LSAAADPNPHRALLEEALRELRRLRERAADRSGETEPVAIIGLGCRFPGGASDPASYWRLLRDGVDAVGEVPAERFNAAAFYDPDPEAPGKIYTRAGAFLPDIDLFDAGLFGIAPRDASALDPQQRLLLEVAWEAIESAGLPAERLSGSRTGVFAGLFMSDYAQLHFHSGDPRLVDAYSCLGSLRSMAAGRLAHALGLHGPALQLDTACSSSLLAVHLACQSLRARECDLALAGGVNLILRPEGTVGACKLKALSPSGRCRPFSAAADGFVRGEGCGVVVLKRLSEALRDGDPIRAVVKGSAVNHDGRSNGLTAPNGRAQEAVLREALANAGVAPATVEYVEAHGTGTALGDPIEALALGAALGQGREEPLFVGSVKGNLGHLEAAAGVASLIKVVLALEHGEIPPHLHLEAPSPHIPWERLPLCLPTALLPWPAAPHPRRAGVSAFGMSGTNVHLVLEEAPAADGGAGEAAIPAGVERPFHLLTLSAKSAPALTAQAGRLAAYLRSPEGAGLACADVAFSANTGRSRFAHRLAVIAAGSAELAEKLGAFARGETPAGVVSGDAGELAGEQLPAPPAPTAGEDAWHSYLARLAQLFVRGAAIDWATIYGGDLRRRVPLPTYPFERHRYWVEERPASLAKHPLLGRAIRSPLLAQTLYEIRLDPAEDPLLAEHRIGGETVLPAAWILCLLLAAAEDGFESAGAAGCVLSEVIFPQPLILGGGEIQLHLLLEPRAPGATRFRLASLAAAAPGDPPRLAGIHAEGELRTAVRDVDFGGALDGASEIPLRPVDGPYPVHPGLLEGGFQVLAASSGEPAPRVPFRLERLTWRRPAAIPSAGLTCRAAWSTGGDGAARGSFRLNTAGHTFLAVAGLEVRPLAARGPAVETPATSPASAVKTLADELRALPERERRRRLFPRVRGQLLLALGWQPDARIPTGQSFFDLGGDSMMALDVATGLEVELGRPLPPTLVFDHPRLDGLVDHLLQVLVSDRPQGVHER
jgi:3-oxoacyl-(acyl-carrier-protein) synthase/acyl carrier protein